MSHGRKRPWYSPVAIARSIRLRPRIYLAFFAAVATLLLLPNGLSGSMRGALAWDVAGAVYLVFALQTMLASGADVIQRRAARQDDSRVLILCLILLAIASSFFGIAGLLSDARSAVPEARFLYVIVAAATIAISWMVTQFVFAIHYAHEYYSPSAPASDESGGLEFPGCTHPDYWDFLYFSTSIGAASQTSDVSIRSRAFRRLVIVHATVSFFFNTMVLALTVNLAASLA